jgi:hypothetical protein
LRYVTVTCFLTFFIFYTVDFALQPKGIRQTLLKERYKHAEFRQRERQMDYRSNSVTVERGQLLYFELTYGGGINHAVCMNTFRNLYGVFRKSWSRISRACSNYSAGPMIHGNTGRRNRAATAFSTIAKPSVVSFLSDLADRHGESYATRFIREVTGMSLRNTEERLVELPSHFTKRQLYAQYCFTRGYKVKADAKGSYGRLSEYNFREYDDDLWPPGSEPLPVCSWSDFLRFWKSDVPHLKIRNPCEDTCGECFKIKNSFYALDRRPQRAVPPPNVASSTRSTLESINELGPSEDGCSVTSSQFSDDNNNIDSQDIQRLREHDYPVEALVLEASKHAMQAQHQRELSSNRINEAKATLHLPWEERR